jgi:hypothetical protein
MGDLVGRDIDPRSVPLRYQEVAPGEFAPEVYAQNIWSAAIGLGRAYILGTGQVELGLAGSVRALVSNPATSGRVATIVALSGMATAAGWAPVLRDPTTGLPAAAPRPVLRMNEATGEAASCTLQVETGTTSLGGGRDTGVVIPIPNGAPFEVPMLGLVLLPGQMIGVNSSFGAAANLSANLYVVEDPL